MSSWQSLNVVMIPLDQSSHIHVFFSYTNEEATKSVTVRFIYLFFGVLGLHQEGLLRLCSVLCSVCIYCTTQQTSV
jgi:hypothetical protein